MVLSKNIKKILVSGAALLMFASVGAASANVNISAKHVRTHRVYRHRKGIRRHRTHRNKRTSRRRNRRTRRRARKAPRRNKRHVRKHTRKHAKKQVRQPMLGLGTPSNTSSEFAGVKPSLVKSIKEAKSESKDPEIPSEYYGNYYEKGKHNYDIFIHLAKHGSYSLSNGQIDGMSGTEGLDTADNHVPTGSRYVHALSKDGYHDGGADYDLDFDNSITPISYKLANGILKVNPIGINQINNDGLTYITLHKINENQGIKKFQSEDNPNISND